MSITTFEPRRLRPAPEPLGNFFRVGYNDHRVLEQAIAEQRGTGTGLVINPAYGVRQLPLVAEAKTIGVETILDTKGLELASLGGYTQSGVAELPWAGTAGMHTPDSLRGLPARRLARTVAEYAAEHDFSAVLAPTHLIESATSPWWGIDTPILTELRSTLDELECAETLIYRPVILRASALNDSAVLDRLLTTLAQEPVDGLWLRLHPFGTTASGPLALKRYLRICRQLHSLGIPLVAEHSGTVGVALLAFGAVGGIESGITLTDTVNLDRVLRAPKPDGKSFSPQPRVYLHELGAFVDVAVARDFFNKRGTKGLHACQDAGCCPRGWVDMIADPRRHFLRQREREVAGLSATPETLRAGQYMEGFLRPATDRAIRAAELEPTLASVRKRLESWRGALSADLRERSTFTVSQPAAGHRLRHTA